MDIFKAGTYQMIMMDGAYDPLWATILSMFLGFAITLIIYGVGIFLIEDSIKCGNLKNSPFSTIWHLWTQKKWFKPTLFIIIFCFSVITFFFIGFYPDYLE